MVKVLGEQCSGRWQGRSISKWQGISSSKPRGYGKQGRYRWTDSSLCLGSVQPPGVVSSPNPFLTHFLPEKLRPSCLAAVGLGLRPSTALLCLAPLTPLTSFQTETQGSNIQSDIVADLCWLVFSSLHLQKGGEKQNPSSEGLLGGSPELNSGRGWSHAELVQVVGIESVGPGNQVVHFVFPGIVPMIVIH